MNRKPYRFITINIHGDVAYIAAPGILTYMMPRENIPDSVDNLTKALSQIPFQQWEGPAIPLTSAYCYVPEIRPDSMAIDYYGDGNFVMWLQAGPIGWPCMRWGAEEVEVNKDGTLRNPHTAIMKIAYMIAKAYAPVDQKAKEAYLQAAREEEAKKNRATFGDVEVYLKETNGLFWKKEWVYVIGEYHFSEKEIEELESEIQQAKKWTAGRIVCQSLPKTERNEA